jgi:sortase (surface protein transpeptidase)
MEIAITIKDKLIKTAISNSLDNEVYEYWDSESIKAAKLPAISTVTKEIFNDPKFQAQLVKEIQATAESAVEDYIYEMMDEMQIPQINALYKVVREADEKRGAEDAAKQEAEEVARMIKILSKAGFKIEKA